MSPARPRPRAVLGLLGAFLAVSVVAGVLGAGLAMPAIGASGVAARHSVDFFDNLPGELDVPPLSTSSNILAADGSKIATLYFENRINVDIKDIAPIMQQAIVAIEDSRFYEHGGIDPQGVVRAAVTNQLRGATSQGASTLTQQYVKNVLVETAVANNDKTAQAAATDKVFSRKLKEMKYAITLEKTMTKQQILNGYLNITFFGNQTYGIEAASLYYFNKHAKDLNLDQAAMLAGMVQRPSTYDPVRYPKETLARRNIVLHRMLDTGKIYQGAYQQAVRAPLGLQLNKSKQGCANAGVNAYFCQYVYELMTKDPGFSALGKTEADRKATLTRGGLTIRTTLDPKTNLAAFRALTKRIPPTDKSHVGTAAVTIEPGTGKVLAINQNKVYGTDNSVPGQTSVNYAVDQIYGGSSGFQTGSTFKAFTLADWLKKGKTLEQVTPATPGPAPYSEFTACGKQLRGETYDYGNAETNETAPIPVLEATADSVNTAFVGMEKQLDLCDIRDTAMAMGVHTAAPYSIRSSCPDTNAQFAIAGTKTKSQPYGLTQSIPGCFPSLTLGPMDISPMTMAAAYATFADRGVYCTPIAVTSITDTKKTALKVPTTSCRRALDPQIAAAETYALTQVLKNGTAAKVGMPGRPAAGKTGTTNRSVQTWFAGYTPQRATAVWVGDPSLHPKSLDGRTIKGKHYGNIFGADFAAPIWKDIMEQANAGLPIANFDKPNSKLIGDTSATVPNVAGMSVAQAAQVLIHAGFKPNTSGGWVPSGYPAGTVAFTSPGAGSKVTKGSAIAISTSKGAGAFGGGGNGNGGGRGGGNGGGGGIFPPILPIP